MGIVLPGLVEHHEEVEADGEEDGDGVDVHGLLVGIGGAEDEAADEPEEEGAEDAGDEGSAAHETEMRVTVPPMKTVQDRSG